MRSSTRRIRIYGEERGAYKAKKGQNKRTEKRQKKDKWLDKWLAGAMPRIKSADLTIWSKLNEIAHIGLYCQLTSIALKYVQTLAVIT